MQHNGNPSQALYIYGGTFDPFHLGHLHICNHLQAHDPKAHIVLIPSFQAFYKQSKAPYVHRLAMLQELFAHNSAISVSSFEQRATAPIELVTTLTYFRAQYPDRPLHTVLGYDVLNSMSSWPNWKPLLTLGHLCIIPRIGPKLDTHMLSFLDQKALRPPEKEALHGNIYPLSTCRPPPISSTQLRSLLQQNPVPSLAKSFIPPPISDYIQKHALYNA